MTNHGAIHVAAGLAPGAIYGALSSAIKLISEGGLKKSQYNEQQKYWFRGIDDVYNCLSPVLAKFGLVVVPSVENCELSQYTNKNQTVFTRAIATVNYIVAATDGSLVQTRMVGEGMDTGDKAVAKALSMAYKSMAIELFCIPIEGDDDADNGHPGDTDEQPEGGKRAIKEPQAKAPEAKAPEAKAPPTPSGRRITPGEIAFLRKKCESASVTEASLTERFGLKSLDEMDEGTFKDVKAWLTKAA